MQTLFHCHVNAHVCEAVLLFVVCVRGVWYAPCIVHKHGFDLGNNLTFI